MKFTIDGRTLQAESNFVAKVIPARPVQPILGGVLLDASIDGEVTLRSAVTGQGNSARSAMTASIEQTGKALVSAKALSQASSAFTGDVLVELDGTQVILSSGRTRFALAVMPEEEFPLGGPDDEVLPFADIDSKEFLKAVLRAVPATASDDALPVLNSVQLVMDSKGADLWTTDRYRATQQRVSWQSESTLVGEALVPAKELKEIATALARTGEVTRISRRGNNIVEFHGEGRASQLVTLEGSYPPVGKLFPDSLPTSVVFDAKDAIAAVGRVTLMRDPRTATPVVLELENDVVRVSWEGVASDEFPATLSGPKLTFKFNPEFLKDGLTALQDSPVELSGTKEGKPVLLSPQDQEDSYSYLLVPIRG